MMQSWLKAIPILLTALGPAGAGAEGLNLTVENVRNNTGKIIVLVFDDAEAFDHLAYQWAVDYAEIPAQAGTVSHEFPGLTTGPYAVFLFHDENGDLDVNHDGGRLLEGVGASGAPNPADMPDFGAASVGPGPVTVTLHYDG